MKGKELSIEEVKALKNGTKVYCIWDNWIGKGEGVFFKDFAGLCKESNGKQGWAMCEIDGQTLKVFEYVEPVVKLSDAYHKAIEVWGPHAQILKAIEELGELQQALSRFLNGLDHNAEEEIADVYIMLRQLNLLFNNGKIVAFKIEKLNRLVNRINDELMVTLDKGKQTD